jgi:hypothetical protein
MLLRCLNYINTIFTRMLTTLRAHLHKLGHRERQQYRLCESEKEYSVHILCHCPLLAFKRYGIWGSIFLRPEDLDIVRVDILLSLVANKRLGLDILLSLVANTRLGLVS